MKGRFVLGLAVCWTALPVMVAASQAPVVAQSPSPVAIEAPAPLVVTPPSPEPTAGAASADVATPYTGGRLSPLPKVEIDLPAGMVAPAATTTIPPPPLLPAGLPPAMAPAKLSPAQIAQQIAPNFNVARDYVRLTQCYGIADFMGAVTRIQAARPGATPQVIGVARSIGVLQDGMQPMVLAASTVRTEARFRRDYDAIARRGQQELATSRTPNVTMQRRLASLDACRGDVVRWRGGR